MVSMKAQTMLDAGRNYTGLDRYFSENDAKGIFLVCGRSLSLLPIGDYFGTLTGRKGITVTYFSDFNPNPSYESVVEGVRRFHESRCDMVVAAGGGSAIDVAKCIKLFSSMDSSISYLGQEIIPNDVRLLAIPTTAGTGSEATKYAVIYYNGEKRSVMHEDCIPSAVLLDASALETLPAYQRKSTMMDAFCHSVESFWSVNSTEESRCYSGDAIRMIMANYKAYLANEKDGNANMLLAANMAGKAINIAQTTAGHAMSYKLTSLYGIAHGHAVAICVSKLWPYMLRHRGLCIDPRGEEYLDGVHRQIAEAMGCGSVQDAVHRYTDMVDGLGFSFLRTRESDYKILAKSVNSERLKNFPIYLDEKEIDNLYHQILADKAGGLDHES